MDHCCNAKESELKKLASTQGKTLRIVLFINLVMFGVESTYGWIAHSTALLADSLDMLGDAFVYSVSLYALGRGSHWSARVSLLKGGIMTFFGLGVLGEAGYRFFTSTLPHAETMGVIGAVALAANLTCAILLLRHRHDDINMRSTWLCSRNDVIANVGVILAAWAVSMTQSPYPDLIVGVIIAALVLRSSYQVLTESSAILRTTKA